MVIVTYTYTCTDKCTHTLNVWHPLQLRYFVIFLIKDIAREEVLKRFFITKVVREDELKFKKTRNSKGESI